MLFGQEKYRLLASAGKCGHLNACSLRTSREHSGNSNQVPSRASALPSSSQSLLSLLHRLQMSPAFLIACRMGRRFLKIRSSFPTTWKRGQLLSSGSPQGQGQTSLAFFPWGKDLGGPALLFSFPPSTWEGRAKASDQRWSLQAFHPG